MAKVVDLKSGETLLEPEAGRGDLLTFIEANPEDVTCVEVAPLFADILLGKGYVNTVCCDFMKWSADNEGYLFDKIVMNPPYSLGRHKEHTGWAGTSESRWAPCCCFAGGLTNTELDDAG